MTFGDLHRMSRYRMAWWFGLTLLVLITGLLYEHYRSVREIQAEHHRVVALFREWSEHLTELDAHVRSVEEREHDLDKRQRVLATEIEALQVFRKTMKKLPKTK